MRRQMRAFGLAKRTAAIQFRAFFNADGTSTTARHRVTAEPAAQPTPPFTARESQGN
jgi:hypothetical protein